MERSRADAGRTTSGAPIGSLLSGIVKDAEELVREHAELARAEVKESLGKARNVSIFMISAAAAGLFGALFLLSTLAFALNEATDSSWIGFGIVTLLCLVAAGVLFAIGKKKLAAVEKKPLPQTTAAIKEDVAWVSTTLKTLQ